MKFGAKLQKKFYINKLFFKIMKTFNRRMWENVLENHHQFSEVEIADVSEMKNGNYYGRYVMFSKIIEGVEKNKYFYCDNRKIKIFNTSEEMYTYILEINKLI